MAVVLSEVPTKEVERDRLAALEEVVGRGLATFVQVGLALAEIRDRRLFAVEYESFKDYLQRRWGFGQQWAYGQIYAAQVAGAIEAAGGELPPGIAADALRPLVPLLNRQGPEAVGNAWERIRNGWDDRQRPPSRSEIRDALADRGMPTVAPERRKVQIGPIRDGLIAARTRVLRLRDERGGAALGPKARAQATQCASVAREIADVLDGLADVSTASARLAHLERRPQPADELCMSHGLRRDPDGICSSCRRPDIRPAAQRNLMPSGLAA